MFGCIVVCFDVSVQGSWPFVDSLMLDFSDLLISVITRSLTLVGVRLADICANLSHFIYDFSD